MIGINLADLCNKWRNRSVYTLKKTVLSCWHFYHPKIFNLEITTCDFLIWNSLYKTDG